MYHHIKKLMYVVRVDSPDPRFGNMLLEQFGGANGKLPPTPGLVDQYVNDSTGDGDAGNDMRGPWNHGNGWKLIESPAFQNHHAK